MALSSTAGAATINVPNGGSIQNAIYSAAPGDTVIVDPGTFNESITFGGNNIEVRSASGPDVTRILGSVSFSTGNTRAAVLRGFEVNGGISFDSSSQSLVSATIVDNVITDGGATAIRPNTPAAPLIEDNVISGNISCNTTPAVVVNGAATITGNSIVDNFDVCGNAPGGGIAINAGSGALIEDNLIAGNVARFGGGIYVHGGDEATIRNNVIAENSAAADLGGGFVTADGGGGIHVTGSNATLVQNLVVGNEGGGILLNPEGLVARPSLTTGYRLISNTTADNFGFDIFGNDVPGILSHRNDLSSPDFYNNLAADGLTCTGDFFGAQFFANNFFPFFGGVCRPNIGSNGNKEEDPKLRGDYGLRDDSPSKDMGINSAPLLPTTDITGRPRIVNGTVDQGALEFFVPRGPADSEVWMPAPGILKRTPAEAFGQASTASAAQLRSSSETFSTGVAPDPATIGSTGDPAPPAQPRRATHVF